MKLVVLGALAGFVLSLMVVVLLAIVPPPKSREQMQAETLCEMFTSTAQGKWAQAIGGKGDEYDRCVREQTRAR